MSFGAAQAEEPQTHAAPIRPQTRADISVARETLANLAECVLRLHREEAERVVALPPLAETTGQALARIIKSECMPIGGKMAVTSPLLRGALYQAMYRATFAHAQPVPSPMTVDYAQDVGEPKADVPAQRYIALHQFADCVVRSDPANSRALVLSRAGGAQERQIFQILGPSFNACVVRGVELTFSEAVLIGILAESLYRG